MPRKHACIYDKLAAYLEDRHCADCTFCGNKLSRGAESERKAISRNVVPPSPEQKAPHIQTLSVSEVLEKENAAGTEDGESKDNRN
jgi:hypothetical protein